EASNRDHHDEDFQFFQETLGLSPDRLLPPILSLDEDTIQARLSQRDQTDYLQRLVEKIQGQSSDVVLMEGPGTLQEGTLLGMSLHTIATALDAAVLLVGHFDIVQTVDRMLFAKEQFGDRLIGVVINDVPAANTDFAQGSLREFLEHHQIPVLGMLPRDVVLRSVSVRELVNQLNAQVLCRPDRLNLMVETMTIGAMNVNSALRYFQNARNQVVVTGGDRTDLQLAALETSTQCLVLTGCLSPNPEILSRAEDLEVPILSVDLDTLTTVEIIDRCFGQVRLHEPVKVDCIQRLMRQHFDLDRLLKLLNL
ncbi:MAG: phosphotransacetylase family protein, partial [Cyanobacteria bacterium]|nr:phosphotransacetylase family protein [Cyanobacteriota bacterium]MDW8201091.1 phosphotransacetylase family protein [Cyanobacteriota bacterium SKYGB_h_bin112]